MYIKNIIILLLFLLIPSMASGLKGQQVYQPGEMLKYQLHYGPINAGEMRMSIEPVMFKGKKALHAQTIGYTTGLADRLFKVNDVYESYMDPESGLPFKAIRNISEGRYRYYNEVEYHRDSNVVVSQKSGLHEVPPGILDITSAIYKLRDTLQTTVLKDDEVIELTAWFSDELYPFIVRYKGMEVVSTRMGRFHALKFAPVSEPGRLFKSEDDITMWFSNDRNFVPLKVKLNMILGSVNMDLVEATGLKYELIDIR